MSFVVGTRNHLAALFEPVVVETPEFAVRMSVLSLIVPQIWILQVLATMLLFRLSVAVAISFRHFIQLTMVVKRQICC